MPSRQQQMLANQQRLDSHNQGQLDSTLSYNTKNPLGMGKIGLRSGGGGGVIRAPQKGGGVQERGSRDRPVPRG